MAGIQDSTFFLGFLASVLAVFAVDRLIQAKRNAGLLPLPPGPNGLPLVGNIFDLPKPGTFEPEHWARLGEEYGPILSVNVLGKTLVLINDAEMALDALEKRSTYSSRPYFHFAGEIVGWSRTTAAQRYNAKLREQRKSFARVIGTRALASQYHELQEAETAHFLLHVLKDPEGLRDHIKRQAGSAILKVVYGYNAEQDKRDPLIDMIQQCTADLAKTGVPGAFLVDIVPSLRHVPDWVPGTGWKKLARKMEYELNAAIETPYAFVKHQLSEGRENNSFVANLVRNSKGTAAETETHQWASASLYGGGADTTVSTITCFFLAMTLYPDVQAKAQAEIDRVVGTDRLPNFNDRDSLPYIEAIIKETLRYHIVIPMGLPHCNEEDTTYGGYRIPKEALVMANVWGITHNPKIYPDPHEFRPERYLKSEGHEPEMDPRKFVFGFGRRVCSGRLFAENTLFIEIAQSLAAFSIRKKVMNGQVVEPEMKSLPGAISHLAEYQTWVEPRSSHHEGLIRALEKRFPWEQPDGETLKTMAPPDLPAVRI